MLIGYPFRIGATSYVIPADILPNVRYLAGKVDDVELVLFELDDGPSNLPDETTIRELRALAAEHNLTYTVHFPLDLRLGDDGDERHVSLIKARRVIECTQALDPWAYVVHLDGRSVRESQDANELAAWRDRCVRALDIAGEWAGGVERLAVENLDTYPPGFNDGVLARTPGSRCIDIGHLWLDGHDPVPYINEHLARTRVVHLHGIQERDHRSLAHAPKPELKAANDALVAGGYRGVVTLEVFSEEDFETSIQALGEVGFDDGS